MYICLLNLPLFFGTSIDHAFAKYQCADRFDRIASHRYQHAGGYGAASQVCAKTVHVYSMSSIKNKKHSFLAQKKNRTEPSTNTLFFVLEIMGK